MAWPFITAVIGATTVLFATEMTLGQVGERFSRRGDVRSYQPASPVLSPYLNLLDGDVGGVSSYQLRVRPQLEAQELYRSHDRDISLLDRQTHQLPTPEPRQFHSWNQIGAAWPPLWKVPSQSTPYRRPAARFNDLPHYYGQAYQQPVPLRIFPYVDN